jgi:hypothetical protein
MPQCRWRRYTYLSWRSLCMEHLQFNASLMQRISYLMQDLVFDGARGKRTRD